MRVRRCFLQCGELAQSVRARGIPGYVKAPNHFKVICSNRLAQALVAGGKPVVLLLERRNGGRGSSLSICEIAGITADAPGATCTFAGQVSGGFEQNAVPTPWD